MITENGSYKGNTVMLNKKAMGAMFSILKTVNKYYSGNVRILLDLFDKMVVPIALYNSEVWGNILLPNNIGATKKLLNETYIRNIVERLQNRFLKYILGVNIKSTNWAVRSELGRTPLTIKVYERIIKYYQHICNTKSKILQEALITNKELNTRGVKTWYNGFKRILEFMKLDEKTITESTKTDRIIKATFKNLYNKSWDEERKQQRLKGKHQIYAEIKTKNCFERYIEIEGNMNIRKAITKMRISSHKFPIETGRYEKREKSDRICPLCCNGVGNEEHYIFECDDKIITNVRKECTINIYKKSPQIKKLSLHDQLKYMLICRDEIIIKYIGIFF